MARVSLSWALILGLLSGIGPLCTDFYLPALPEITQQLQATSTQTQLSLTAALIGLGLGQQGALVFIAGDGSRQHRAAGAGKAL